MIINSSRKNSNLLELLEVLREDHARCLCDPTVYYEYTAMVKTRNKSLLETTCRHTVTFATKDCCDRTLFEAKFLFEIGA